MANHDAFQHLAMDHVAPLSAFDSVAVDGRLSTERELASALSRNATQMWSHYRTEELSERAVEKIHLLRRGAGKEHPKSDSDIEGDDSEPESIEASASASLLPQQHSLEQADSHQPQLLKIPAQKRLESAEKKTSEDYKEEEGDAEVEITEKVPVEVDQQVTESNQEGWENTKTALQTCTLPIENEGMEKKEGDRLPAIGLISISETASVDNKEDISSSSNDEFETPPSSPISFNTSPFPQLIQKVEGGHIPSGDPSFQTHLFQGDARSMSPSHQPQPGTDDTDAFSATDNPRPDTPVCRQGVDRGVNTDLNEFTDQASNTPIVDTCWQATNTDKVETSQKCTNTEIETEEKVIWTDRVETSEEATLVKPFVKEKAVNTELSAFELLKRVHSMEKMERLEAESRIMAAELNEEKSKRMVGDSLVQMLQSEIVELRQSNATETTSRLRLENEVTSVKVQKDCTSHVWCIFLT